jgi:hypothetical protein
VAEETEQYCGNDKMCNAWRHLSAARIFGNLWQVVSETRLVLTSEAARYAVALELVVAYRDSTVRTSRSLPSLGKTSVVNKYNFI